MNNITNKYLHPQSLQKFLFIVAATGAALCCLVSFNNIDKFNILILSYYEIIVFASLGALFCNGVYFSEKRYFFYILFLVWIILTFFLRGEFNLTNNENRIFFILRCAYCGIFLPFSKVTDDIHKRKILAAILFTLSFLMCIMLCLAFWGVITNKEIGLFDYRMVFGATYTYTGRMRLRVMFLHYYYTGIFSVVLFFCTLYLAISYWKGALRLLWIFMLAVLFTGVFITYSRTAVLALVVGCLLAVYYLLGRKISDKKLQLTACVSVTGVAVTAAGIAMNKIYIAVNSIRDIWYGITTLSSRTIIWASVLQVIRDYPLVLLRGLPLNTAMDTVNIYLTDLDYTPHMHNAYLQTLLYIGLPGLVALSAFLIYLLKCIRSLLKNKADLSVVVLCIIPVVIMLMGITESCFACNPTGYEFVNFLFALTSGYIIELANAKAENNGR